MTKITWTINVNDRRYWGNDLDKCWSKLRSLKDQSYFKLKILYHHGAKPPRQVWAGPGGWRNVYVTFIDIDYSDHSWTSNRPTRSIEYFNCSRWMPSEIEQFISFYTQE